MQEQTVEDETLGTLIWDSQLEWWEGRQEITPGQTISVTVSSDDAPLDIVLEQARQLFRRVQAAEPIFRRAAADALLDRYNSAWNEGAPISSNAFMSRMAITALSVYADGGAEIDYSDGDLFLGHTITLSVDKSGSAEYASING